MPIRHCLKDDDHAVRDLLLLIAALLLAPALARAEAADALRHAA